jgi:hypothetical protein
MLSNEEVMTVAGGKCGSCKVMGRVRWLYGSREEGGCFCAESSNKHEQARAPKSSSGGGGSRQAGFFGDVITSMRLEWVDQSPLLLESRRPTGQT